MRFPLGGRAGPGAAQAAARAEPGRMPPLPPGLKTAELAPGSLFGEIAALGRVQRSATVYAEDESEVLEMRWQALRDIKSAVVSQSAEIVRLRIAHNKRHK